MTKTKRVEEEFSGEALDALIGETRTPAELEQLFRQMKKRIVERMLDAELSHHLGYAPGEAKPADQPNHSNGTTPKTGLTDDGALPLDIHRDRAGTVARQLVPEGGRGVDHRTSGQLCGRFVSNAELVAVQCVLERCGVVQALIGLGA